MMKKLSMAFLAVAVFLCGAAHCFAGDLYNKSLIRQRAKQGECASANSDDCVNVIGGKVYKYQSTGSQTAPGQAAGGNLSVGRDGKLTGDNIPRDMRQETIREVHQYVDADKKVGSRGGNVEVGGVQSDSTRKVRQVENIVDVKNKVGGAGNVSVGAVNVGKGGKVGAIDNKVTTKGVNADGRVNIGGVRVGNGAAVDEVNSDVQVDGDINANGPINVGGVRITNGTIGSVRSTTVIKGNINATGN